MKHSIHSAELPYQLDLEKPAKIHFIGIGGISMSGIAMLLLSAGFTITGSDAKASALTQELEAHGARIYYGQRRSNIEAGLDAVVYTAAIHPDNPEFDECVVQGVPMLTRAQMLGEIMTFYRSAIGISGTHGKTTTTSMVSTILLEAGRNPTLFIGGVLNSIHGNLHIGSRDILVTESCEYTNSFLSFHPNMEIILNIEEDHLDFFKDINDIRNSFAAFAGLLPSAESGGLLVINAGIERLDELTQGLSCRIVTFGAAETGAAYTPYNITYDSYGCASFDVLFCPSANAAPLNLGNVSLHVPGEHNVLNALAAIALCRSLEVPMAQIIPALAQYTGTERRFEKKGEIGGVTIIDDYAHHPAEITATLKAAANYPHNRIWCVFQPHTYTRTKALFTQFADALALADEVVLADIYAARETDTLGISSADLRDALLEKGVHAHYFPSFDEIENFLLENCIHGDLLITMGAGDIVKIGESLLGK